MSANAPATALTARPIRRALCWRLGLADKDAAQHLTDSPYDRLHHVVDGKEEGDQPFEQHAEGPGQPGEEGRQRTGLLVGSDCLGATSGGLKAVFDGDGPSKFPWKQGRSSTANRGFVRASKGADVWLKNGGDGR